MFVAFEDDAWEDTKHKFPVLEHLQRMWCITFHNFKARIIIIIMHKQKTEKTR